MDKGELECQLNATQLGGENTDGKKREQEKEESGHAKIFELQQEVASAAATPRNCNPRGKSATPVQHLNATPQPVAQPLVASPLQPLFATPHPVAQHQKEDATPDKQEKELEMSTTQKPATTVQPLRREENATPVKPPIKAKVANYILANPRLVIATSCIIIFVLCNTAFLAFEQQKGFVSLGYSLPIAWGIAVLFEVAIEVLSISVALSKHMFMKIALCLVLGSTVYTLANMVSASAKENVMASMAKPTSLMAAEQNLNALSNLQSTASNAIRNYDPKKDKNKIIYATAEFNKKGGLGDKFKLATTELAEEQAKFESSESYIRAVRQSQTHGDARKIAVAWNIVLMLFLGHLFKERSEN